MNEDDYAEFSVLVDATIVVDRIDLDDSDNDLIYTDIDAKDLAIYNHYSLDVARVVLARGRQPIDERFNRVVYELERAIRSEFGYVHVYPSKPTYNHPYVSDDGDVLLHGELNMNIQIKGIKNDNLMTKIEQVVAAAIEHSANEECTVEYEVTLDDKKSIDREKLFKLIENRYADFAWYGELSRYTIRTSFGELEIEYR